jgi:phospholipid/cholesterol/gamma-HCH transport system substrate-binding protein
MTSLAPGRSAFRVGVLTLLGALSFTVLFVHATNRVLGADRSTIFIRLNAADGLQRGDAVLLRGVTVGGVKALEFDARGVIVRVRLTRAVPLSDQAGAELVAADMFGRQSIVLRARPGPGVPLADGDTLSGHGSVPLNAKLDRLSGQVGRLLGDTTIDRVHGALQNAAGTATSVGVAADEMGSLARDTRSMIDEQRASLTSLTGDAARIARRLRETADAPAVAALPERLERSAANLVAATETMDSVAVSLAAMLAGLRAGRGSAGMLLSDAELYERTTGALSALERLLDDVRQHPKRYINVRVF